jgi:16S rRNA (guanine966-N2)-methyltransferase
MRLTGGSGGGRKLRAPRGLATRPTAGRAREAIFDVLASRFGGAPDGAQVLDLYAGAGTLGLEALSRGAERCVFVDRGAPAVAAIRQNLSALAAEDAEGRSEVIRADVTRAVGQLGQRGLRFDLVFVDPPYASDEATRALEALDRAQALTEEGVVVVEHAARRPLASPVGGLSCVDARRYGDTAVSFFQRTHGGRSPA